jgi:hypothetical protein
MPPEVLILTSFRQRVVVAVVEQVVAVVVARQQVVAVERVVVAVVERAAVVVERVAAVQQVFSPLQAVRQAFAGMKLPTELCLPLQVAIASSFYLPPKKFYSYYIVILNGLSSFL